VCIIHNYLTSQYSALFPISIKSQIKNLIICLKNDVIIAAIIVDTAITSMSQRFTDESLFFKNFKTILDTIIKEIINIIVFDSIIKKSFIISLI